MTSIPSHVAIIGGGVNGLGIAWRLAEAGCRVSVYDSHAIGPGTRGATWAAGGMLAADMACGVDNELIGYMQSLGEPNKLPLQPFLDIGVRACLAWELWKGRKEV